jgi:hypothetical protein
MLMATRHLAVSDESGVKEVVVRIFMPERNDESWICRYEIDWPHQTSSRYAAGFDSVQAVVLALQMIGSEIYTSNYHRSGSLRWTEEGRGYGFPVPYSLRDVLVGDDVTL